MAETRDSTGGMTGAGKGQESLSMADAGSQTALHEHRWQSLGVFLLVLAVLGLLWFWGMRNSISTLADLRKSEFRLRRLGLAVNQWVLDHGYTGFPRIRNPPPQVLWQPGRPGSAEIVLAEYLSAGPLATRRQGESDAEWLARRRRNELTACPFTGFEYWYNASWLFDLDPQRLARGEEDELHYFASQQRRDGTWPVFTNGRSGRHAIVGFGMQRQETRADGGVDVAIRLECRVVFEPRD